MNIDFFLLKGLDNARRWKRHRECDSYVLTVQASLTGYIQAIIESDRKAKEKLAIITKAMVYAELAISVLMDNVSYEYISGISVND